MDVISQSEADTDRLGQCLARALQPSDVITLHGDLGAGKTRLVRAVVGALAADASLVTSPTFVLVQEYPIDPPIVHIDAYRLRDSDELLALGFDEILDAQAVLFIEWADRVADVLPKDRLRIQIAHAGETSRQLSLIASGRRSEVLLQKVETAFEG